MGIDYDTLFWFVDGFYKGFEPWYKKQLISGHTISRRREGHLTLSEVLTIIIAYHQLGCLALNTFPKFMSLSSPFIPQACALCAFCQTDQASFSSTYLFT